MLLAHRIRLDPTADQREYFARAAGTARRVWNWALAEWLRQRDAGGKPNAMALKKQFNAIKYCHPDWLDADGNPWLRTVHRDSHAQPFAHLARAWSRFFEQIRNKEPAHPPRFKKKGRCADSFYIANDKFRFEGMVVVLPLIGAVRLSEQLRLSGKIMGATVRREAQHWFLSVQVEVPDQQSLRPRTADGVVGIDLGITAAATLSTGEKIVSPRPLKAALRRLRIRSRRASRKHKAAKAAAGIVGALPKGTRLPVSQNSKKASGALGRLHARVAALRSDFTHKLTTRLCRENQTLVIEDLHVKGMMACKNRALHLADIAFGTVRRQLVYKAVRYGCELVVADRWYPSSKLCSGCGAKNAALGPGERSWTCAACGATHDRDINAAINLERLATGAAGRPCAHTALPVASLAATSGTGTGLSPAPGGEVTPVRYEHGQQDGSGQEEIAAHFCARS